MRRLLSLKPSIRFLKFEGTPFQARNSFLGLFKLPHLVPKIFDPCGDFVAFLSQGVSALNELLRLFQPFLYLQILRTKRGDLRFELLPFDNGVLSLLANCRNFFATFTEALPFCKELLLLTP